MHNNGLREHVEIENRSLVAQPLTGWVLASLRGNQFYVFPAVIVTPDETIRVHSGSNTVSNPPHDWLWTKENVWRNASDVAVLFDVEGQEIARHAYPAGHRFGKSFHKVKVLIAQNGEFTIADEK